ncbi:hypothetical protein DM860_016618 [Cuscuta australis]|uniref:Uncharacterized protein n=1 Tax=Cuscuta australis TaxID=267555 RepID=A0A328DKA8_9ASTE|nr:hypothetical protein DM860_016618 [Cuscuta australis]
MPHVVHPRISYIEDLIKDDDVDSLVALVELQLSEEKSLRIDCELDLAHVIRCVISHEAVRCATALFHGKTELVKDINVFPHEPRPPPFSGTLLKPFHTCSLPCANQFAPLTFHPLRSLRDVPVGLKFLNTKGWNLFASSLKRGIRFALK